MKKSFVFCLFFVFIVPSWSSHFESLGSPAGTLLAQNHTSKESPHIKSRRKQRSQKKAIKPQYQNCQGQDIHQLDKNMRERLSLAQTEAQSICFDCALQESKKDQHLKALTHTLQQKGQMGRKRTSQKSLTSQKDQALEHDFKEKLQKRALGLIQTKIAEMERLKACLKGDRNWFATKAPTVDWPLMKEVCKKDKKAFKASIRTRWPDMRINMALTSAKPNQVMEGKPNLNFPLKHEVSIFGKISKLTPQEQEQAKKIWAKHLSKVDLKKLNPKQFEEAFLKGDRSLNKNLSLKEGKHLRQATFDMHKTSRDRYRQILEEMPLLAYLKTGDPDNQKDIDQAFSKMKQELTNSLKKIKSEKMSMELLLAFKPLVEGLITESKGGYCLIAERARVKVEKEKSLKKTGLLALAVVSATPCFIAGPVGSVLCLGSGLSAGGVGYFMAKAEVQDSLGRALTGKEYERMADLADKDKEKFWELILIPTAGFGTTAGAIKGAQQLTKKMAQKKQQAIQTPAKALWSQTPHIDPKEVSIKKVGSHAESQVETFQVQWTSSKGKTQQLQLAIPKEYLEKQKLELEERIKRIDNESFSAGQAERLKSLVREQGNVLFHIQKYISQMSEESFEGIDKISLDELESMLINQYKNKVFDHFAQTYSQQAHSKLSSIGTENVVMKKTGDDGAFTEYDVQFNTQKGKKRKLKLKIAHEDETTEQGTVLLNLTKFDAIDHRALSHQQKMQLAIGQMPAEIFKGLKSITINTSSIAKEENIAGMVESIKPGKPIRKGGKWKYELNALPDRLALRFPINVDVVHAFMKATKSTKSEMFLSHTALKDIPFSHEGDLTSNLAHELGHVMQNTKYSLKRDPLTSQKNPPKWSEAIQKDNTSVSAYGDTLETEDFAEALRVYIQTDGGTKSQGEALRQYAHRFEILDNLMKKSMTERESLFNEFKSAIDKKGIAFVAGKGVLTHVIVQDQVYVLPPTTDEE